MANCLVVFYYLHGNFVDWVIRLLFCVKFLAHCGFPDLFIQVVSPKSFLFMPTRCPGSGPDSSQHVKLSSAKALLRLYFNAEGISILWHVSKWSSWKIGSKEHFKLKMVKISMKKKVQQVTFRFFLDLMMWKIATTSMSVFQNLDCLSLVVCSNTTLLKLQTVLFLFFFSNSPLRYRGCGLSMDAAYTRTFMVLELG